MKLNQYRAKLRIGIAFLTVLTSVFILSGTALATGGNSTGTVSKVGGTGTSSSTQIDDESEILSSENWNELLNVSSEESSQAIAGTTDETVFHSPLANGIGKDSIFIWGCIAVGLGVLGIAFFIYSQFIYKHVKKPAEQCDTSLSSQKSVKEISMRRGDSFKAQIARTETVLEKPGKIEVNSEYSQKEITSVTEPKTELPNKTNTEEIDWDQFFENYKKQQKKDE